MKLTTWSILQVLMTLGVLTVSAVSAHGQPSQKVPERTSAGSEVVAEINGRSITLKEIDNSLGPQLYSLQERIYLLRRNALNNLLIRELLEETAREKGITVEELRRQLMPQKIEILESEADRVYLLNQSRYSELSEDEAKQKIKAELESRRKFEIYQAALTQLKDKARISILLQPPPAPEVVLSDQGPSKGAKNAAVTIIEFSDFQCPYCREATATMKQVLQNNPKNVRLVFKHMPLSNHSQAFKAAQAAFCAGQQGKFWEYHDLLFDRTYDLSLPALNKYASELGLKSEEFKACIDSPASREAVMRDIYEATKSGVTGTPTFFINGRLLRGAGSVEYFQAAIEKELKKEAKPNELK
ncbi:MAG: thioredoxin domain-containing protein [Acidobacteriota bacterium]